MTENLEIDTKILDFQNDLLVKDTIRIFHKYVVFDDCFVLNRDAHINLRQEIADHFGIHPSNVLVVGSAKMGFSIAASKRYRPFGVYSDIDIAIVSSELFDQMWEKVFNYYSEGKSIGYLSWPKRERQSFSDYLFRGWIRPDKLPQGGSFELSRNWWEFFRQLYASNLYGSNKITAGVYKSWNYLERYHSISIDRCRQALDSEQIQINDDLEEK